MRDGRVIVERPAHAASVGGRWRRREPAQKRAIGLLGTVCILGVTNAWTLWDGRRSRLLSVETTLAELRAHNPANPSALVRRALVHSKDLVSALAAAQSLDGKAGSDAKLALNVLSQYLEKERAR